MIACIMCADVCSSNVDVQTISTPPRRRADPSSLFMFEMRLEPRKDKPTARLELLAALEGIITYPEGSFLLRYVLPMYEAHDSLFFFLFYGGWWGGGVVGVVDGMVIYI